MQARQPAEWQPHQTCWTAWPSREDLWGENLPRVQAEMVQFCQAIAESEPVSLLVQSPEAATVARERLAGLDISYYVEPFGDIWIRDTGPIFLQVTSQVGAVQTHAARFSFNGWGEKYLFPEDLDLAERIAHRSGAQVLAFPWVLEGGSLEVDGQGMAITTEECLLNPNRNRDCSRETIEGYLRELGIAKVIWLRKGLANDHTDGHIDNLARFVAPGVVLCMRSASRSDPNSAVLSEIEDRLKSARDQQGKALQVMTISSPGEVVDDQGRLMPASYMNFYIANAAVVVPQFGVSSDQPALALIQSCFPKRRVVGVSALGLLTGGGAFHCITQQQPL